MERQKLSCCFTGHRQIEKRHVNTLTPALDEAIERMIADGFTEFRAGGAMGFDTVAALKIIDKRKKYPHIRLVLYLPCRDQASKWTGISKEAYAFVLKNADDVIYTADKYYSGCMHLRDRRLVEGADACIAYCTRSTGGTAYTYGLAIKNCLTTVNIADSLDRR